MADKAATKAEEAVEQGRQGIEEIRREARRGLRRGADMIREHPRQSALGALGIGILLAQLPLRILATGLMGVLLMLLKPAALLYAGIKIAEDYKTSSSNGAEPIPEPTGVPTATPTGFATK